MPYTYTKDINDITEVITKYFTELNKDENPGNHRYHIKIEGDGEKATIRYRKLKKMPRWLEPISKYLNDRMDLMHLRYKPLLRIDFNGKTTTRNDLIRIIALEEGELPYNISLYISEQLRKEVVFHMYLRKQSKDN